MTTNMMKAEYLSIDKLHAFEGHPFQVKDDAEMEQLVWSILTQGLLTPIIVRPLEDGEYEVISGHRRLYACKKAGLDTIPVLVCSLDRDAAAIALVDSNLHREHILPSEKAFAYKLKMDAMSRQGQRSDLTPSQVATRLDTAALIGKAQGDTRDTVYRYIRLTRLIPELLKKVDEERISLTPAVELSYLSQEEQYALLDEIELNDCTPSLSQACRLKKLSQSGELTQPIMAKLMREEKANQRETVRLPAAQLRKYAPKANQKQLEEFVLRACEYYQRFLNRRRENER